MNPLRGIGLKVMSVTVFTLMAICIKSAAPEVPPGPLRFWLTVTLEAHDTPQDALRDLVETASAYAPMSGALRGPIDVAVDLRFAAATGT